ncbi:threonine aldolase family protein [Neobacillus dielmonensis]|uniref:threonine aldolase family protein n=1 Tax=Neobacillus dielmonensis TaxID=1347369 RepID=UPI0005A74E2F|nr:beta-eliminating lyase-related protein [Neobacillus dielmonensis]
MNELLNSFKQTKFQLAGHGFRNVGVMKQALAGIEDNQESDMYGNGNFIEDFQTKLAAYLGKESAVFFPSGTMAQQIALRIWCDEQGLKRVAYHPLCHLEIHEQDGLKELHHIDPVLLADKNRVIQLEDVTGLNEEIACLLLELPQREIGGQLPDYESLARISAYCREQGIRLHLDGARLFEILPYYGKTAAEICSLFDSVYVSFYKGIGGVAGAILAGDSAFTEKSKVWKRRHGGDLISLYPYIISADYLFEKRVGKMEQYYQEALELARLYNQLPGVATRPIEPVSNMFHVRIKAPKDKLESVFVELHEQTGIGFTGSLREISGEEVYYEVSIGDLYEQVPQPELTEAFQLLGQKLKEI